MLPVTICKLIETLLVFCILVKNRNKNYKDNILQYLSNLILINGINILINNFLNLRIIIGLVYFIIFLILLFELLLLNPKLFLLTLDIFAILILNGEMCVLIISAIGISYIFNMKYNLCNCITCKEFDPVFNNRIILLCKEELYSLILPKLNMAVIATIYLYLNCSEFYNLSLFLLSIYMFNLHIIIKKYKKITYYKTDKFFIEFIDLD